MSPGEAAHHRSLAPVQLQDSKGSVMMHTFDPEGEMPYCYAPGDGPNQHMLNGGGRNGFYSWLEGAIKVLASPFHSVMSEQEVESPPERSQFSGAGAETRFRDAQAQWYREHGDGTQLQGTRREQNTLFDRLKDRLLGLRRLRANPSGTPRNSHPSSHSSSQPPCDL